MFDPDPFRQLTAVSLIAFFVTLASAVAFRQLAERWNILDCPDDRKIHSKPVPLLGGAAIAFGVSLAIAIATRIDGQVLIILAGAVLVLLINLLDDIRGLSAKFRFTAECAIALGVIFGGVRISFLPAGLLGDIGEILITMIWFVGLANAFNYLDGMDGLAAGSTVINSAFFAIILYWMGQYQLAIMASALSAGCIGFLPHNFRQKKMFLGDAGSTFIGFLLAGLGVVGNWGQDNVVGVSIPLLILGVPIFDMVFTTIMRTREGKIRNVAEWLKYAGKDHFHHYLADLGFKRVGAVIFIWLTSAALGLSAIMVTNDRAWEGVLTILQASIIFGMIAVLMVMGKKRRGTGYGN